MVCMAKASAGRLRLMAGLVVLVALLPGCGVTDGLDRFQETIEESLQEREPLSTPAVGAAVDESPDAEWAEYADETGTFAIDFPTEPEYVGFERDGVAVRGWSVEWQSDGYGISEFDVGFGKSYDFDRGVIIALDGVVASVEEQLGKAATYDMVEQRPHTRDGYDGVHFVATVATADDPYATVHGAVYNAGGTVVLLTVTDGDSDNTAHAERFIDSLELSP